MTDDGPEDGGKEYFCLVYWRPGSKRLIHWHWPRSGILTCTRAAEVAREHLYS